MKNQSIKKTESPDAAIVIAALTKNANPIVKKLQSIEVKTQENFEQAVILLKSLKELGKKATETKSEIVDPIKLSLSRINSLFKPFENLIAEMDATIKLKLSVFYEQQNKKTLQLTEKLEAGEMKVSSYVKKVNELAPQSEVAQFRKSVSVIITDKKKIPLAYMVPDEKKILADLKAGKKVPGAKLHTGVNIAI